jgi:lipoprotein-anchoring transpeptidase ErfK/SrfK
MYVPKPTLARVDQQITTSPNQDTKQEILTEDPIPTTTSTQMLEAIETPDAIIMEIVDDASNLSDPTPAQFSANGTNDHWIDVNLSEQRVYAYEGNTIVNSFLVSTGLPDTPTVIGQYKIYVKVPIQDMSGPGYYLPNVPWVMYFYESYGFHGTYWHNNFGKPMSRGCVNMKIEDAKWLYDWAAVGTFVNVHY